MSKKEKIKLPEDQQKKCMIIIHGASVAAGGAGTGLAQIPLADSALITPIQIGMIITLGKVFDQSITASAAKAILGGAAASLAGRSVSQVLVGWIPLLGNAINTATAAGITEVIGWMAVEHFYTQTRKETAPVEKYSGEDSTAETQEKQNATYQELMTAAKQFIDGEKNLQNNEDELDKLLNEIWEIIEASELPSEDPLNTAYEQLIYIRMKSCH